MSAPQCEGFLLPEIFFGPLGLNRFCPAYTHGARRRLYSSITSGIKESRAVRQIVSHLRAMAEGLVCVLRPGGLFCVGERVEEAKERFNARYLESVANALVDADAGQGTASFIVGDIGTDQSTDASRVDVGNAAEIDDKGAILSGSQSGLKKEERSEHHRSLQTQNALAGVGTVEIFNVEWLLR